MHPELNLYGALGVGLDGHVGNDLVKQSPAFPHPFHSCPRPGHGPQSMPLRVGGPALRRMPGGEVILLSVQQPLLGSPPCLGGRALGISGPSRLELPRKPSLRSDLNKISVIWK